MNEKKIGIEETKDVYNFLADSLEDLAAHKSDDGKIDLAEWGQTAIENAPGAVKAFIGIDKIDDEMNDLDDAETREVAVMGVSLMKKLADLFFSKKAE